MVEWQMKGYSQEL